MMPNDLTQVERVDGEEDGPKDRTLRPTLADSGEGSGANYGDKLSCWRDGKVVEEAGHRCQRQMRGPGK